MLCGQDFGNRISWQGSTPLFDDRLISHAALNLFQHISDHDACAAECWFAMADGGVGYDVLGGCFCFHRCGFHCFSPNLSGSLLRLLRWCGGWLWTRSLACRRLPGAEWGCGHVIACVFFLLGDVDSNPTCRFVNR